MIRADYHTHSYFSTDSQANPIEMLENAEKLGLEYLCVTDHMDIDYMWDESGKPLYVFDMDEYLKEFLPLKEQKGFLRIGVEFGLQPGNEKLFSEIHKIYNNSEIDFSLGSIHILGTGDPYQKSYWNNVTDAKTVLREYFERMLECIKETDDYDSLSHFDYILRYIPERLGEKKYDIREYAEYIDAILEHIIKKDKALEINTKGILAGLGCFHPCTEVLKEYIAKGGKLITIGSDAHQPELIAKGYKETEEILKNVGIKSYFVYEKHVPKEIGM